LKLTLSAGVALGALVLLGTHCSAHADGVASTGFDKSIDNNAARMMGDGRQIFRFDTFGDEAFWGDALQLHKAIAGEKNGGVGSGVSPKTALAVGLKVDLDALPSALQQQLKAGQVNLDDPATTLALLKLNAVVGSQATSTRTGASSRWGFSAPSAIRPWTTRSPRGSDEGLTVGRIGISTWARSYRSHRT